MEPIAAGGYRAIGYRAIGYWLCRLLAIADRPSPLAMLLAIKTLFRNSHCILPGLLVNLRRPGIKP